MSKHTPGPWQYVLEGGTTMFITEADGSTIICVRVTENTTAHSRLAANARLIAAAPALADAALLALIHLSDPEPDANEGDRVVMLLCDALRAAGRLNQQLED